MEETTEQFAAWTAWLKTAPALSGLEMSVDEAGPDLRRVGVFPQGVQVRECTRSINGGRKLRCRRKIRLRLALPLPQGDGETARENAERVTALQGWIEEQSALGLAPHWGNTEEQSETLSAEEGRLERTDRHGGGVYSLLLIAEYTIQYKGEEA